MRITSDSGPARNVSPENGADGQKLNENHPLNFKAATSEVAESSGDFKLKAWDEQGLKICIPHWHFCTNLLTAFVIVGGTRS